MKAQDLRIGNILNYQTSEGETLTTVIDWQDLKWISEDETGFNLAHSEIELTEEWLLKLGFKESYFTFDLNKLSICLKGKEYSNGRTYFNSWCIIENQPEFVHQLQNLYFALCGEELELKETI